MCHQNSLKRCSLESSVERWIHCEAALRANLQSVWVTNRSQKRRSLKMPLHRGTVRRMPSSTRVRQWMHSIKRGGVRNSSLLRACAIEPKLSQVLGVFCTPSKGSSGTHKHSAFGKWKIGLQLSICETWAWSALRQRVGRACPVNHALRFCC